MKDKLTASGDLKVRQEAWGESPCSHCRDTPCCRNLPMAPLTLDSQRDFVNLLLISCYEGLFPALKSTGEWTVYLRRDCRFLDRRDGKCGIHGEARQSLICKSYDAHNCWYIDAFDENCSASLIPFNTERLIWLEKTYGLIGERFAFFPGWEELYTAVSRSDREESELFTDMEAPLDMRRLSFRKSREKNYLFLPPYQLPRTEKHFELLSFRLSFPGVYLAVTDNIWAFLVNTAVNPSLLNRVRDEFYPALDHGDGLFSFPRMRERYHPYSERGEQWILLRRHELPVLKRLTEFDASGNVKRLPSGGEILSALHSSGPGLVA